jgi:prolyl oligopeptidase
MQRVLTILIVVSISLPTALLVAAERAKNPVTRRVDHVDTYHGVDVPDPYRWLEDDVRQSSEVAEWVEMQNKHSFGFLEAIPQRESIRKRVEELWNFPKYSTPMKEAGRYFYFRNDGLQNQAVLYMVDGLEGEARVLIDPNTWTKDGTIALGALAISDDGEHVAYSRSEAGSDWSVFHVLKIADGKQLDDTLRWTKHSGASWTKDGKGFFYSRYPQPKPGEEFVGQNYDNKLYYHRVGTPQSDDVLVYYRPEHREWRYSGDVTEDGRYLVITIGIGTDDRYRIVVRDLAEPYAMPIELVSDFDNEYTLIGNQGSTLYFKTDLDAPRQRLIAVDLNEPEREHWREIIPQRDETLTQVSLVGERFIASYLKDVKPLVNVHSMEGKFVRQVELPGIGAVVGFEGKKEDPETFYAFLSFATPPTIYRYNVATGATRVWRKPEVAFNPDDYEVEQVFYTSKDGTRVPMFLSYKKGLKRDGNNPTLLYGYGGFNISLPPVFAVSRLVWMEMGGLYAQPNLRGGGEYGLAWHKAGTKLQKQNVFDDFIAAAEWLVENKYTQPSKLGIQGGSNGGLLVGAVMTQRPKLFGACLPAVGVMDMLRFHQFTGGRLWTDDYGSADDPEEFKALFAYSPYHNLKPGTCYPPTMVTTADTDDRVVPGHSFKFAARLQEYQSCDNPVLIRISVRAGHGAGKPTSKRIEEAADDLSFLVKTLGME